MIAHRHEVLHFVEATLSTGRDFKEQKEVYSGRNLQGVLGFFGN
jgi:hypothetical protein